MANVVHICKICTIFTIFFFFGGKCVLYLPLFVCLQCKLKLQVQSKYIKILKKKKKLRTKLAYLKEKRKKKKKKERKRVAHQLTKPKTLFMNLLAQFMYLIEIEVSYSLLETILAKINNAPQEEIKNVFYLF